MFKLFHKNSAMAIAALAAALACSASTPASASHHHRSHWRAHHASHWGRHHSSHQRRHHASHQNDQPASQEAVNYSPRPFDGGGNVLAYFSRTSSVNYSARQTVIAGVCASACTMKLGARNACVTPDAELLFHQASSNGVRSELATRIMLYAFPQRIRHWVLASGALNSSSLTALSGRQAIAMGVRAC